MSVFRRISNLFSRSTVAREIDAELQSHIEMRIEANVAQGMSPEEARRDALLKFGNPTATREKVAHVDVVSGLFVLSLDSFFGDVHYAVRKLCKSSGFAVTVIATLALGIGANTAIFSIVDAVLLRPLPYKNANRLVVVWQTDAAHRGTGAWFEPYREFEEWQHGSRSFEKLAAMSWATTGKTLVWRDKPIGLLALPASTDFFSMLGVEAQIGRTFNETDLNNPCTLVLAYPFWQQKLGAPNDIVGRSLTVDHSPCVVVGVMPKDFAFYPKEANAWSLITPVSAFVQKPWNSMTGVFGLLKTGVTRAQAEAELNAIEKGILPDAPASLSLLSSAMPVVLNLQDNFTWLAGRNLRTGLWVLLGAVSLILLMACLNVGNLLLGRAMEHSREMAIRTALGSGRARLIRQMLTESLVMAFCGTGAGILLAIVMLDWLRAANPVELPPGSVVFLDWRVLLFTALLGVGSAIVFGLFPAWQASRVNLNSVLKNSERGIGASASAQRTSQVLVVMQIAFSLMLFVGAGLLATSLRRMASTQLGYRTDHVLTAKINLPKERYADGDARSRFAGNFARMVSALSGVEAVTGASNFAPIGESPLSIEGDPSKFSTGGIATQSVSANFFETMQIPLFRGRVFGTQDRKDTEQVAIVNEALANKYFPHSNPIGHAVKLSRADDPSQPWLAIIGVVANIKTTTVFQEMGYVEQPTVYRPLAQDSPASLALMVVTREGPLGPVSGMEEQLASMDHDLVLGDIGTMQDRQSAVLSQPRFRAVLFGSFAGLALVLAVVGLYGIQAQMVVQRTREIAIRMAVGASRGDVLGSVFRKAFALAGVGIVLGVIGSAIAMRALAGLLYGVRPENTAMFVTASATLMVTALFASWNPAWRAANVDPLQVLRAE
ncbi:MAG TPA: ABC transporter permease [Acidobacteriaceae bacterium]